MINFRGIARALDGVFERWGINTEAPTSRAFRRHGIREEPDTARKTAPKGGARKRRFLEVRRRQWRRNERTYRKSLRQEAKNRV